MGDTDDSRRALEGSFEAVSAFGCIEGAVDESSSPVSVGCREAAIVGSSETVVLDGEAEAPRAVGMPDDSVVGRKEGDSDGASVSINAKTDGDTDGTNDGATGCILGLIEGEADASWLGTPDGMSEGESVGNFVGVAVGVRVGDKVGAGDCVGEGVFVGEFVGNSVGDGVVQSKQKGPSQSCPAAQTGVSVNGQLVSRNAFSKAELASVRGTIVLNEHKS